MNTFSIMIGNQEYSIKNTTETKWFERLIYFTIQSTVQIANTILINYIYAEPFFTNTLQYKQLVLRHASPILLMYSNLLITSQDLLVDPRTGHPKIKTKSFFTKSRPSFLNCYISTFACVIYRALKSADFYQIFKVSCNISATTQVNVHIQVDLKITHNH